VTPILDQFTGDGTTQIFALTRAPRPGAPVLVWWNGLLQSTPADYVVAGQAVALTLVPALGDPVQVEYYPAVTASGTFAAPVDLTSLDAVKQRAELDPKKAYDDDVEIQAAITGFSRYVLNKSGVATLNSVASLLETYDGNGNERLFLRSRPILTLSPVTVSGVTIPVSTGFGVWGVFVEDSKKSIAMRSGPAGGTRFQGGWVAPGAYGGWGGKVRGPNFLLGTGNVQVPYTAGYPPQPVENEPQTVADQTIVLAESPWVADGGVVYASNLVPLAAVAGSPAAGQYVVADGLYAFNAADNGQKIFVSYSVARAPEDLEYAARCACAINYKRKSWQDQASRTVSSAGSSATTRYRDWEWPPEVQCVIDYYIRRSVT
jgi:hypothetical protein